MVRRKNRLQALIIELILVFDWIDFIFFRVKIISFVVNVELRLSSSLLDNFKVLLTGFSIFINSQARENAYLVSNVVFC